MATAQRSPAPPTAPMPPTPKSATHVTVACKIPGGLVLQLNEKLTERQQSMTGERDVTVFHKVGPVVLVRGPAQPAGAAPRGYTRPTVVGGAAFTPNVPADFWDEWLRQHKDMPAVKNGMIYAHSRRDVVAGWAREHKKELSGLEPLNPDGDPRMPAPIGASVEAVKTADEMAARQPLPPTDEQFED